MADQMYFVGPDDSPDKYRLKRQLGSGGEAQLWEAELDVSGTWEAVAVKVLRADHFEDIDRWKQRWTDQAEVLRFIRHPGVVGVREHFEGSGMHYAGESPPPPRTLYLVMNMHTGETLREWAAQHRSQADGYEALRLLAQVADVLDWLHSGQATPSGRPVIHADVTANNVLVTPTGQSILVDFGLVRLAAGISPMVEGTEGYVAPEVRNFAQYSEASDRYAFGALTYFVLTGSAAPTDLEEIRAGLSAVPAVVEQPALLDHLIRMFNPDPAERPACGEWIRYFRSTGATSADVIGVGATAPIEPGAPTTPMAAPIAAGEPSPRRRRILIGALIGALIAVIVGGAIGALALRSGSDDAEDLADNGTTIETTGVSTTLDDRDDSAETTMEAVVTAPTPTDADPATTITTTPPTTTTTPPTTTTTPPTTTTVAVVREPGPVPSEAYNFSASRCAYGRVDVANAPVDGARCALVQGRLEDSFDVNISPNVKRLTGSLVLTDDAYPVEAIALVTVSVDGVVAQEGLVNITAPFLLDVDVVDKRRATVAIVKDPEWGAPTSSGFFIQTVLLEPLFVY